jgi:Cd(II)/Pb(II)-responsive transcriptional regulator
MKIGELAKAAGTQPETIRYYEREGLLPAPARTESNYRAYGEPHVRRLAFIRHCRSLDMTLAEIRTLLQFKDAPTRDCAGVDALLDEHIAHVAARIKELKHLQKELKALRVQCGAASAAASCGILGGLEEAARGHARSTPLPSPDDPIHVHGAHAPFRPHLARRP